MNVKEITVSLSGVIPVAAYENLRPGFSITVEPDGEDFEQVINRLRQQLHQIFELEANRGKADLLDKQYSRLRFHEKDGKKYPSVTSILGWDLDFHMTDDDLRQYASRGNVVEALINGYLQTGQWLDPLAAASLREDVSILMSGSLMFTWENCTHKQFLAEYGGKIKAEAFQKTVFNDENLYAGTSDIVGQFDGVRSVMDIKTGGFDMRQLAAYAICEKDVQQLVVLPVGPTDNKCGYKKPIICDTVQAEFSEFLKARAKFKQRFGV